MIRDSVNPTMMRRPDPYEVRTFCADCHAVDYVARLVQPFRAPILLCRSCREKRTGVSDTRNMRTPITGHATISSAPALAAPAPTVVRGLLTAGASIDPPPPASPIADDVVDWILEPADMDDDDLDRAIDEELDRRGI